MKKKKILKITAFVVALALTLGLAFFANALVGNPVSKYLAKSAAEKHLEANYADKDYCIDRVMYDFKSGCYHAFIESLSSPDSSFSLTIGFDGRISWDNYDDRVEGRFNTSQRINNEYRDAVDKVFESKSFPYKTHIAFGDILFVEDVNLDQPYIADYAIQMSKLELDGYYDIGELGKQAGELVVYVYDDDVSVKRLSEILLGIKDVMNKSGVEFKTIDLVLEPPKSEDGYEGGYTGENRIEVEAFLCEDIYERDMKKRVAEAAEATRVLDELRDSAKQQEIDAYEKALTEQN